MPVGSADPAAAVRTFTTIHGEKKIQAQVRFVLAAAAAAALAVAAPGADHREAPLIREDLTADIADVYAFLDPADETRLVLALTVNPFSAPSENFSYNFSPNVRYGFRIDTDGDAEPDADITARFFNTPSGLEVEVRFPGGIVVSGAVTPPTDEPDPAEAIVIEGPMGIKVFAGQRDDPFFFDVVGFVRVLAGTGGFTGSDGFAGFNVSAIVVELPLSLVQGDDDDASDFSDDSSDDGMGPDEGGPLQIWGTTERRRRTIRRSSAGRLEVSKGPWEQIERMGNPAVNTALIPAGQKDFFNIGQPRDDAADFAADIVASLTALGTTDANIAVLASVAVPDTLKLDPAAAIGYPNGRDPDDYVIDVLFFFIFNQTGVSDLVDANDKAFLDEFPFLAPPHQP